MGPWYSGEELSLAKPLLRSLGCSSLLSHRAAPPAMDTYPDATPFRGNCGAPACRAIEQPCLQCTTTHGLAAGSGKISLCGRKGFGGTGLEKNFLGSVVRCTARGSDRGVDGGTDKR